MHAPRLTVDVSAVAANYRLLSNAFTGKECASVVKADAYGLGVKPVARALAQAGCETFFVATLEEGVALRSVLPRLHIFVFHGPYKGEEEDYAAHNLIPVLNSLVQLERWNKALPHAIHIDTGMCRLGLTQAELERSPTHNVRLLVSHLACANEPQHPKNAEQLARFQQACALFPGVPASLCNSSGVFLPANYHFTLARPGCALYGINPVEHKNPMWPVVNLTAPILQIRTLDRRESIGYGATAAREKGARIAILQMGYADGYLRMASNAGHVRFGAISAPVVGRVSMDMIAVDVSAVPQAALAQGTATLLDEVYTVNDLARDAGTIGYELFTRLGNRLKREYVS